MDSDYINGYIERRHNGGYEGKVKVDGVDLSPIEGVYFKQAEKKYLWLKRKPLMEYDFDSQCYKTRKRQPQWEAYLEKQSDGTVTAYKGEFVFLRFRYSIIGVWDAILGKEKSRLNLYVERLPMSQQTILNKINERRKNGK